MMCLQEAQLEPESFSPAELSAAVQSRVRRIADQAFWDSVSADLAAHPPASGNQSSSRDAAPFSAPPRCGAGNSGSSVGRARGSSGRQRGAAEAVVELLADLGADLAGVLPPGAPQRAYLEALLDGDTLRQGLLSGQVGLVPAESRGLCQSAVWTSHAAEGSHLTSTHVPHTRNHLA